MVKMDAITKLNALQKEWEHEVDVLGQKIGFGNMMDIASRKWDERLKLKGLTGGAFVVGPCKLMTFECGCKNAVKCDWCCGSGWLTKHVKEIKDKLGQGFFKTHNGGRELQKRTHKTLNYLKN